jgi:hypothetical protein
VSSLISASSSTSESETKLLSCSLRSSSVDLVKHLTLEDDLTAMGNSGNNFLLWMRERGGGEEDGSVE